MFLLRLALLLIFQQLVAAQSANPVVLTEGGSIEGITVSSRHGKKVDAFLGIPYATPPVGNLRFKPPVKYPNFAGVFKALSKSKACIQFTNLVDDVWIPRNEDCSEDCLYLNVWVPNPAPKGAAVIFFLHGGAFESGTANSNPFDGTFLPSEENVILVTANYRLSVLGFLMLDDTEAPGNVALMDQAMALQWIREHISKFGGDPEKVTIIGHSAGGRSAGYHLLIPSSDGLFRRVVLLSGTSTTTLPESGRIQATARGLKLAGIVGCDMDTTSEIVKCLRDVDIESLVNAVLQSNQMNFLPYGPVADGEYIPHSAKKAMKEELNSSIDILLGTLSEDSSFWLEYFLKNAWDSGVYTDEDISSLLKASIGADKVLEAKIAKYVYTDWDDLKDEKKRRRQVADCATDYFYVCPLSYTANVAVENGNTVYHYQLRYRSKKSSLPKWMKMAHGDELNYLFGWPLNNSKGFSEEDKEYSKTLMRYVSNFAKTGNPNSSPAEGINWPKYSKESQEYLYISSERKVLRGLRNRYCEFWNNLLPAITAECSSIDNSCDIKEKNH